MFWREVPMRQMLMTFLLLAAALQGVGVAAPLPGPNGTAAGVHSPAAAQPGVGGFVEVIRRGSLANYRGMVGDAFDRYRYFKVKEWREARGATGSIYVDFYGAVPTGLLDVKSRLAGIASKGVVVKFVIYPNGEYGIVMVTKTVVMKDGKSSATPIADIKEVVDAIYGNKKLDL
jgi:hypothetical protein